ncbi:MAG: hypothetical protein KGI08_03960 [Thaumarchaeota archaeon]|nr:hypothetical protein [Nitrososphaerota archaeon]
MVRLALAVPVLFLVCFSLVPVFADVNTFPVIFGSTYQVNYNANGVKIQSIEPNPKYDELTVSVQVSSPNASLDLTIPRALLDSKQNNNDIPFIAVIDGTLENIEEKNPTGSTRTISIQLTPDNKQIEIIGTYLVTPKQNNGGTTVPSNPSLQTTTTESDQTENTTHVPTTAPTQVPPSTTQYVPPTTQTNITQENMGNQTNTGQNIVFKIPYLPNMTISLSPIDYAVIGAILLVVIIVITSAARKRPNKITKKR